MEYYNNVYLKRLNRYGLDYQSRTQGNRERQFELLLLKSLYRVEFEYNGEMHPGSFEKYKQDETETLHYLLTRINLNIPNGTVLMIPKTIKEKDEMGNDIERVEISPWMVYYLEHIETSGYNRYIMLRMSDLITWTARDGSHCESWAYFYGQENNMLKNELQARSRADARYTENLKSSFFIMPLNPKIKKDDYLLFDEGTETEEAYVVTGYDIRSSKGVEYVTVDPVYIWDKSPIPKQTKTDDAEDFFWFGGETNGS